MGFSALKCVLSARSTIAVATGQLWLECLGSLIAMASAKRETLYSLQIVASAKALAPAKVKLAAVVDRLRASTWTWMPDIGSRLTLLLFGKLAA